MKQNISIISKNGFSLLEITIVLIVISILLSAVIPVFSRAYLEKASNRVILDIAAIQEAARKYYIDNNQWPIANSIYATPVAVLQAGGYLPSAWEAINPFGASASISTNYTYNVSSNSSSLTVCSLVPSDAQSIVENSLTSPYIDTIGDVCSSVPVPGGGSIGFGASIPVTSGAIYYANSNGFLEGNATTYYNIVGFNVLSDSNPNPSTELPDCNQGAYSGGNGGYPLQVMVHCIIYKGNYYQFNLQNGTGYTVNFIPLNS